MFLNLILKAKKSLFLLVLILGFSLLGAETASCSERPARSGTHSRLSPKVTSDGTKSRPTKGRGHMDKRSETKKGSTEETDKTSQAFEQAIENIYEEAVKEAAKLGFSFEEMAAVFGCIGPLLKMVEDLEKAPTNTKLANKILSSGFYKKIKAFVTVKCSGSNYVLATSLPFVGSAVAAVASRLTAVLAQADRALAGVSSEHEEE